MVEGRDYEILQVPDPFSFGPGQKIRQSWQFKIIAGNEDVFYRLYWNISLDKDIRSAAFENLDKHISSEELSKMTNLSFVSTGGNRLVRID